MHRARYAVELTQRLNLQELYELCLAAAAPRRLCAVAPAQIVRADNPFLLSYVVYHHFRSLGWVVKNGTKFCVDFLLYKRGPVFSHAEFAVVVIPEYEDEGDARSSPFPPHANAGEKDWVWFSMVNRVNTQVQKTLVLAHVTIPSMASCPAEALATPHGLVSQLRRGAFHIREVTIRRWVPARMKP